VKTAFKEFFNVLLTFSLTSLIMGLMMIALVNWIAQ